MRLLDKVIVALALLAPCAAQAQSAHGTVTAADQTVVINSQNRPVIGVAVTANTNVTITPESTVDGTTWATIQACAIATGTCVTSITSTGAWQIGSAGMSQVRLRVASVGATPTATISMLASSAGGGGGGSSGGGGGGAVTMASGAVASGAYSSGSIASGALASGSMVDFLTTVGSKAAGTAATSAQLGGGVYNSSAPSLTNGQQAAIQLDASGNQKVVGSGPADNSTALASLSSAPIAGVAQTTATTCTDGNNCIPRLNPANRALSVEQRDPCNNVAKTTVAFSQTTIANIIAASASNKNYICSVLVNANGGTEIFSIVEDDTSGCGSPTVALVGSLTAANGIAVGASSGWSGSGGGSTLLAGITANRYVCILQSGSTRLSGYFTYVQAP